MFENGTEVTSALLVEKKIIRKELDGLKVLGNGELTKKLTVKAVKFTGSAKEKIEAVGGTAYRYIAGAGHCGDTARVWV